jgi:hypothetical protein
MSPRRATLLLVLAAPAGCAVGDHGLVVGRYTHTPTATVSEVFGVGVLLRPSEDDRGLALGYRRRTVVVPAEAPREGCRREWRWFSAPVAPGRVVMTGASHVGLDVTATPAVGRAAFGYRSYVLTPAPAAGSSVVALIFVDGARPCATAVRYEEVENAEIQPGS